MFCLAAPSSHRVDRGRHLASSTFAGVLNVELSLPIFRLPRSRSLSLGEGLTDSTGARDGTRAAWCVGSRAAPAFFVLVFCLAAPSSYRVDRGRHLASSTFAGVLNVELSLPIFRLPRSRSLSLGEGLTDSTGARDGTRADGVLDRGRRRLFRFSVLPGGAVELPGRSRPAPGVVDIRRGTQCRALSPDFPAAALAVFIPWRGADGFDRRAGWHPR